MNNTYYLVNKHQLMKQFYQVVGIVKPVFVERYGESLTDSIILQTRQEFESLLFQLPYIGGNENPLTGNLVQATWYISLYRVFKSYGKSVEETGEMCYLATEAALKKYPRLVTRLAGKLKYNRFSLPHLKQQADQSQKHLYSGDWVFTVVEGDGRTFDFGVDYTECGIAKFYHILGADELLRYVCLLDYPVSAAMGTGLSRSHILVGDSPICNCRYKPGREISRAWPPTSERP